VRVYDEPMTTTATALRSQMRTLTAGQSDETLLGSWIAACTQRIDSAPDQAPALRLAMDTIEAELIRRGMTAEQFDALFLATIDAHDAR
jgi:hypothetical protein